MNQDKIIVADDQLIHLEMFKDNMQKLKLHKNCIFTNNGREAIEVAKHVIVTRLTKTLEVASKDVRTAIRPISIMILDLQMPHKNGIEVIRWVVDCCENLTLQHEHLKIEPPIFVI